MDDDLNTEGVDDEIARLAMMGANRLHQRIRDPLKSKYDPLLEEWAALNGLRITVAQFWLLSLADGKRRGFRTRGGYATEQGFAWPARDHAVYFNRGGRPAAILTEPYWSEPEEVALRGLVARMGLVLSTPPNPYASLWFPASTSFAVITNPAFGEVRWLPDQLEFEVRPRLLD